MTNLLDDFEDALTEGVTLQDMFEDVQNELQTLQNLPDVYTSDIHDPVEILAFAMIIVRILRVLTVDVDKPGVIDLYSSASGLVNHQLHTMKNKAIRSFISRNWAHALPGSLKKFKAGLFDTVWFYTNKYANIGLYGANASFDENAVETFIHIFRSSARDEFYPSTEFPNVINTSYAEFINLLYFLKHT